MPAAALPDFVLQRIDRESGKPVNRQIYQVVREAILSRMLPAGMQLPSSRCLARELAMSRNTVMHAYEQLIAEGFVESRAGAGTFIADTVPDHVRRPPDPAGARHIVQPGGLSARGVRLVEQAGVCGLQWGAFMPGVPDVTMFPARVWSRLNNRVWRRARAEFLTYDRGAGHLPLREAIAAHLRVARSVDCTAQQVLITAGIHQSIDLAVRLLAETGERAWVEDPCYWGTRSVLESHGMQTIAIPVDGEGMQCRAADWEQPPRLAFVTPSHQYPLGMVMSLARRRALLEYAAAHGTWIVEDDYDSEFRYAGAPIASLQGMDTHDRVLYAGTFSKTLFPGLRLGYLVVPQALATQFGTGLSELYRGGQTFTQAVLAEFISEGFFVSYIRRMRMVYASRLRLLGQAIEDHFGDSVRIRGTDAGLHLALELPEGCDDVAISRQAMQGGCVARALSRYYMDAARAQPGLVLGYACVPDAQVRPAFDRLAAIIKAHM